MKSQPFQDHFLPKPPCLCYSSVQDPHFNIAWQINKQLTTVNIINAALALVKCQAPGSKLYIKAAPSQSKSIENETKGQYKGFKHSRSPISDTDDRQSCPVKARSCINRCPPAARCNTFSRTYESDTESKTEDYKPRHFTGGSLKIHEHYNTITDDEHSHLDTSAEDEHSSMDNQSTPMPTPS